MSQILGAIEKKIKKVRYSDVTNIWRHGINLTTVASWRPGFVEPCLKHILFVEDLVSQCRGNNQELSYTCQLISSFTLLALLVINPSRSAVSLYTVAVMAINLVSWLVVTKWSDTKKSSAKITGTPKPKRKRRRLYLAVALSWAFVAPASWIVFIVLGA